MANCSDEMYLITLDTKLTPLIQNTTEYLIKVSDDTIFRPECGSRFLDANIIKKARIALNKLTKSVSLSSRRLNNYH